MTVRRRTALVKLSNSTESSVDSCEIFPFYKDLADLRESSFRSKNALIFLAKFPNPTGFLQIQPKDCGILESFLVKSPRLSATL